jgi:hypothetical protein
MGGKDERRPWWRPDWVKVSKILSQKISWALWPISVIPATWEAYVGGSWSETLLEKTVQEPM